MSDEPSSSASAAIAASPSSSTRRRSDSPTTAASRDALKHAQTQAQLAERRKKNREMFNRKRGELLDDLIRNLDILVYAELSAVYYMDCSFLRLLVRAIVQFAFLTPKPAIFPEPPQNRPYVGTVFGGNILCMLLHLWLNTPVGSEATRGYLHGGLAMDFVGQKGPTCKLVLLAFDLLVLALQSVQLCAVVARLRLKQASATPVPGRPTEAVPADGQDLDSEERGVRRSAELQRLNPDGGIEMQTLDTVGRAPTANDEDGNSEREALLASTLATTNPTQTDAHIFDAFHSGQIVLADLEIWTTIKEQFWAYQKAPPERRVSDLGARLASSGFSLRMRRAGTTLNV